MFKKIPTSGKSSLPKKFDSKKNDKEISKGKESGNGKEESKEGAKEEKKEPRNEGGINWDEFLSFQTEEQGKEQTAKAGLQMSDAKGIEENQFKDEVKIESFEDTILLNIQSRNELISDLNEVRMERHMLIIRY